MTGSSRELGQIQRWMQAVIMHPDGVIAGIGCHDARQQIDVDSEEIESVVRRSQNQSSIERLQVYAGAYYARLLECLREEFSALAHALDKKTFDGFAIEYIQTYPSTSYTLANLGRQFPQFLMQTRPADIPVEDDGASYHRASTSCSERWSRDKRLATPSSEPPRFPVLISTTWRISSNNGSLPGPRPATFRRLN
jgi:hypothetical protein